MKLASISIAILLLAGCTMQKQQAAVAAPSQQLHETAFHAQQKRIIDAHVEMLVEAGRVTDRGHFDEYFYLGQYAWHVGICDEGEDEKPVPCSFGSYSFYEPAFRQAVNIYIFHGQIAANSDILVDVGSGAFDRQTIGKIADSMTYCELTGGVLRHCDGPGFAGGKVIEFIDKNHVRLDHKSRWNAERYGMAILTTDYVDMCTCHGFGGK